MTAAGWDLGGLVHTISPGAEDLRHQEPEIPPAEVGQVQRPRVGCQGPMQPVPLPPPVAGDPRRQQQDSGDQPLPKPCQDPHQVPAVRTCEAGRATQLGQPVQDQGGGQRLPGPTATMVGGPGGATRSPGPGDPAVGPCAFASVVTGSEGSVRDWARPCSGIGRVWILRNLAGHNQARATQCSTRWHLPQGRARPSCDPDPVNGSFDSR